MSTITMNLFKKTIIKEDKSKFDTFFLKFQDENVCISCNLTNECKKNIVKSGVEFPMEIDLTDDEDYFITQEEYLNKDNIKCLKDVVVIQKFTGIRHLELPKTTLSDILNKNKHN